MDNNKFWFSNPIPMSKTTHSPVLTAERSIVYLSKKSRKEVYDSFTKILVEYTSKMPSSICKDSVLNLIKRGVIFLGRNISDVKSGIIGTVGLNPKNQITGIVLDVVENRINTESGETSDISMCYYSIYFEFIRAAVIAKESEVSKDNEIHKLLADYLHLLMLKLVGKGINLTEKQKIFLDAVTTYFYHRFLLQDRHPLAKEATLNKFSKEVQKEIDYNMSKLEKYTSMKDIFKGLIDYNIVYDAPNALLIQALNMFKPFTFYCFTTSLDYLIAMAIVSKYPVKFLINSDVNSQLQTKLETKMKIYFDKVSYDINALTKV